MDFSLTIFFGLLKIYDFQPSNLSQKSCTKIIWFSQQNRTGFKRNDDYRYKLICLWQFRTENYKKYNGNSFCTMSCNHIFITIRKIAPKYSIEEVK